MHGKASAEEEDFTASSVARKLVPLNGALSQRQLLDLHMTDVGWMCCKFFFFFLEPHDRYNFDLHLAILYQLVR